MYFFIPTIDSNIEFDSRRGCYTLGNLIQLLYRYTSGYIEVFDDGKFKDRYHVELRGKLIGMIYESESWEKLVNEKNRSSIPLKIV